MTSEQLEALERYEELPVFSDRERLVLRLADAVSETPVTVSDQLYDELRLQFTEPQLVELSSALAWENYRARFNRVFQVGSEDFSAGAYCPLPTPPTTQP